MPTVAELDIRDLSLNKREIRLETEKLEHRKSRSFWLGPLGVVVTGAFFAWLASMATEIYKANNARAAKLDEIAIDLVKTAAQRGSNENSRQFLQYISDSKLASEELQKKLEAFLTGQPDARLPPPINLQGSPETIPPPAPSNQPARQSETGWFYLGKVKRDASGKDVWDNSSAIGTFGVVVNGGVVPVVPGKEVGSLLGATIETLGPKYLRGDGAEGQRVRSPVKRVLDLRTRLKVNRIDTAGRDGNDPVWWAEVTVQ
jgi:hypothetical protein